MKVRLIQEGFFKNPEEMKNQAEKKKEMSKAQALANTSNKIVKEGIENFLNAALRRDYEKEFQSNDYEHMYFLPQHIFGKNTQSVIYLSLIDKPKEPEEMFMTKANLLEIKEDEIDIDIDIRLLCKEALQHIKVRQNSDRILGDSFFKKVDNLTMMKKIAERHVFDMYTGVRITHGSYISSDYYSDIRNEINHYFNTYIHSYFEKNVSSLAAHNTIEEFLLNRFNDGTMKFNINKIHLLRGIAGNVVLGTSLAASRPVDPEIGIKYDYTSEVVEKFQKLFDLFSFENTGDLILRDQYSNIVEAVVKQGGTMNEGYFKNPEEKKKEIENRKIISNVESLARTANDLILGRIEQILDDYLNDRKYYYNENMFLTSRTIGLPKFTELFYISMGDYNSKPVEAKNKCPLSRFKTKVSIDEEHNRIDIDIYPLIQWNFLFDEIKHNQQNRDNGIAYPDCIDVRSGIETYGYYHDYYQKASSVIRLQFKNKLKEELCNQLEKSSVEANKELYDLLMMMFKYNIYLRRIHMFEGIDTDVVVNLEGYYSIDETVRHKLVIEELINVFSFENLGNVIFVGQNRRGFRDLPKIVVQKDKVFLR